jgi:tRNA threonylcarbamoyladenosine biosynthesis protein TsaB
MITLGIDTSTFIGSAGIIQDDKPLAELSLNVEVTHSERLLSSIETVISSARLKIEDIDLFAYAKGPGSFTGLRIGLSTIKGLAFATGKKIVGVSSLLALAMNARYAKYTVCPMIDARKGEVYTAIYEFGPKDKVKVISKEDAFSPEEVISRIKKKTLIFGTGARIYADVIKRKLKDKVILAPLDFDFPSGISVATLGLHMYKKGKFDDLDSVIPNYLRKSEAELNYKR